MTHIANDYETLLDHVYEEGKPDQRRQIEQHLAECKPCADVVCDFQSVRGRLSAWAPPATQLGFTVVQERPPAAARKQRWYPAVTRWSAWAQAAAAVVLFASGMAVSQLNVEYANGGLTVSLHRESGVGSRESGPNVTPAPNGAADSDALMGRVQAMIDGSEQRQQQELALKLAQVVRDFDAQRRADLLRVEQNLGQLEGQTGAAMAQQRDELLNYLVRVSQSQTQP